MKSLVIVESPTPHDAYLLPRFTSSRRKSAHEGQAKAAFDAAKAKI